MVWPSVLNLHGYLRYSSEGIGSAESGYPDLQQDIAFSSSQNGMVASRSGPEPGSQLKLSIATRLKQRSQADNTKGFLTLLYRGTQRCPTHHQFCRYRVATYSDCCELEISEATSSPYFE
jgi:hypothetical protein